jgi:hypothetical protein
MGLARLSSYVCGVMLRSLSGSMLAFSSSIVTIQLTLYFGYSVSSYPQSNLV